MANVGLCNEVVKKEVGISTVINITKPDQLGFMDRDSILVISVTDRCMVVYKDYLVQNGMHFDGMILIGYGSFSLWVYLLCIKYNCRVVLQKPYGSCNLGKETQKAAKALKDGVSYMSPDAVEDFNDQMFRLGMLLSEYNRNQAKGLEVMVQNFGPDIEEYYFKNSTERNALKGAVRKIEGYGNGGAANLSIRNGDVQWLLKNLERLNEFGLLKELQVDFGIKGE